jgi:hypothetical protein
MGAASSTNIAEQTLNAITNIATKMMNDQKVETLETQGIIIKDAHSSVIISGNHFNQSISINLESLLKAISTQSAQQDLMQEISQVAESLNKQLNLFQFSDSENIVRAYLNATISLSTNITQVCISVAKQSQVISIDTVDGFVKINNNTFNQTQSIMSKCMFDSLSNSQAIQTAQQSINQSAKAVNEGVNIWAIVIMIVLGILLLILPELLPLIIVEKAVMDVVKIFLDMFFVLMIFAGVILIVCFMTLNKNIISLYGDVIPISLESGCAGSIANTSQAFKNPEDAGNECLDKKYQAFDYQDGNSTFYSSVSDSCQKLISSAKQTISRPLIVPKIFIFSELPNIDNFNYKDVVILISGKIYFCNLFSDNNQKIWSSVMNPDGSDIIYFSIPNLNVDQIKIVYSIPSLWPDSSVRVVIYVPSASDPIGTEYRIYTDPLNLSLFNSKIPPPLYNYQPNPDYKTTQWTGFNIKAKKLGNAYFWIGLVLLLIGFIGIVIQLATRKKQANKKK